MEKSGAILPLTVGLATSAMIRRNHALLMPEGDDPISLMIGMGTVRQRMEKTLPEIVRLHDEALRGECSDPQVLEEFNGSGFYSLERDAGYEAALAEHAEAYDLAKRVLRDRRKAAHV